MNDRKLLVLYILAAVAFVAAFGFAVHATFGVIYSFSPIFRNAIVQQLSKNVWAVNTEDIAKISKLELRGYTIPGLKMPAPLRRLQRFFPDRNVEVKDPDLVYLEKLPRLQYLDLRETEVTGVGLEYLAKPDNLEGLWKVGS